MMNNQSEIKGITCDVTKCKYHDGSDNCCAGKIHVGHDYANCSAETVCETFVPCDTCKG